jgi:predicted nucleotide-binding protein/hypoxanthine phosphoribosyltransferase
MSTSAKKVARAKKPTPAPRAPAAPPKKRVLILSSSERLDVAKAVKSVLEKDSGHAIEATVWDRTGPKGWLLEHIVSMVRQFPFVVVVLAGDDGLVHRGRPMQSPRDNVIMELGLAMATNGIARTFIVGSRDSSLKLPTDINGLYTGSFGRREDGNWEEAVRDACGEVIHRVKHTEAEMSWDLFLEAIRQISGDVMKRGIHFPTDPGFRPHIVVGVNMGGFVVGGLLFYLNRSRWHLSTLWTKSESPYRKLSERQTDFKEELRAVVARVREETNERPRILLVDDSDKSGESMSQAVTLIRSIVADAAIKRAAIVYLGHPDSKPDYAPHTGYDRFKYAPV